MTSPPGRSKSPRGRSAVAALFVVLLVAVTSTACAPGSPEGILTVPGNYVADLTNIPGQGPEVKIIMCLDTASAVRLQTGDGGGAWVGRITLEWYGDTYTDMAPSIGTSAILTTPVLLPGCGLLTYFENCCHTPQYLAISAVKV